MSKMKSSLGRGLDALINPNRFNENEEQKNPDYSNIKFDDGKQVDILAKIAIDFISPNPFQPRMNFDPITLEELKKSNFLLILQEGIQIRFEIMSQYDYILKSGKV